MSFWQWLVTSAIVAIGGVFGIHQAGPTVQTPQDNSSLPTTQETYQVSATSSSAAENTQAVSTSSSTTQTSAVSSSGTVPLPTIDKSSLTSNTGNPTITGTYPPGWSGLDLEITNSKGDVVLQDTTTITNGRWSYYVPQTLPAGTYTVTILYARTLKAYQNVTGTLTVTNSTPQANPNPPTVVINPGSLTAYSTTATVTGTVANVARFCIDVVAGNGVTLPTSAGLLQGNFSVIQYACTDNGGITVSDSQWSMPLLSKVYTTGAYTLGVYNEDGGNILTKGVLTILPASQAASTSGPVTGWVWTAAPGSPKFATLEIPDIGNPTPFQIYIWNGTSYTFYQNLGPGTWLDFPQGGVSQFEILGVSPTLDINPSGHSDVFGISFATSGTANFTRTAITQNSVTQSAAASTAPAITLTSPSGGQQIPIGSSYEISWQATGMPSGSFLEFSLVDSDGTSYGIMSNPIDPTQGSYSWSVKGPVCVPNPNYPGTQTCSATLNPGQYRLVIKAYSTVVNGQPSGLLTQTSGTLITLTGSASTGNINPLAG